jgi:hypothetical protein
MAKTKIEIEVETTGPDANGEFTFVGLKVGDGQSIPLPPDAPAPRRLARDLAAAVRAQIAPNDEDKAKAAMKAEAMKATKEVGETDRVPEKVAQQRAQSGNNPAK